MTATTSKTDQQVEPIQPIRREADGAVSMLDQTRLPQVETYIRYDTAAGVATGIRDMIIRGAPAIGVAASMGLALGASQIPNNTEFGPAFEALCTLMAGTRPTAVNLFWGIERMQAIVARHADGPRAALCEALDAEADRIYHDDIAMNRAIGDHGAALIPQGATVLTHCNTGSLATAGYGTALGVIRSAHRAGKGIKVIADETRPYLQGSRLTAWECLKEGIDVTVIADSAAGHLISRGMVTCAIVGADRIVANGDAANKIGTYQVAVMCHRHGIPFYVAAPTTTVDLALSDGTLIPIEERSGDEVRGVFGHPVAPEGVKVLNPGFDVTPASLIAGIVTEMGVARPPYETSLAAMVAAANSTD